MYLLFNDTFGTSEAISELLSRDLWLDHSEFDKFHLWMTRKLDQLSIVTTPGSPVSTLVQLGHGVTPLTSHVNSVMTAVCEKSHKSRTARSSSSWGCFGIHNPPPSKWRIGAILFQKCNKKYPIKKLEEAWFSKSTEYLYVNKTFKVRINESDFQWCVIL